MEILYCSSSAIHSNLKVELIWKKISYLTINDTNFIWIIYISHLSHMNHRWWIHLRCRLVHPCSWCRPKFCLGFFVANFTFYFVNFFSFLFILESHSWTKRLLINLFFRILVVTVPDRILDWKNCEFVYWIEILKKYS